MRDKYSTSNSRTSLAFNSPDGRGLLQCRMTMNSNSNMMYKLQLVLHTYYACSLYLGLMAGLVVCILDIYTQLAS